MIENIEQAEHFVTNLKRSDNWVSNDELHTKLKKSYALIQAHEREDLVPITCVHIALYYIDLGEYGEAWQYTETARIKAEQHKNYDAHLNSLSLQFRIQRYLGNNDIAQEIVNKQIEIALEYNNAFQLCSSYLNQAVQYRFQNLKSQCIEAYEKSLKYAIKSNNIYYISMTYINYSGSLIELEELKKAKDKLKIGYKIALENNLLNALALVNANYGKLYDKNKKFKKSADYYKKAVELYHTINNTNEATQAKILLAEAFINLNQFDEAEMILANALEFSIENNIKNNLNSIYLNLSNLFELKENFKNSLYYFKKHKTINEELYNNETDKRIKNLEVIQQINILKIEKKTAESMASIKHDFLANMSHEIRTPINSVLGICYLLQQQSLNEVQENYVNRLKRSGENLLGIINDVLDISKIESGKMELIEQSFSLNTLLQDVYNTIEPKSIEKNLPFYIEKKYENDILLKGDVIRLQQVLINLVANAIKFTSSGNVTLKVESKVHNLQTLQVVFKVVDTGIGIPKNKLNTIFGRYEQATAEIKTTFGGTGLGLSISKKIIELMRGNIVIKSKLNIGSEFIITIPFYFEKNKKMEKLKNKSKQNTMLLNNKTILIADDNTENRLVAKDIFDSCNKTIKIIEALNGFEVIDILLKQNVDFIFIDLDMPKLNGIETVQKIRKNKKFKNLPIIGNTASLMSLNIEEIKELGFDDFIYKPYKPEELISKAIDVINY
ncbi:MAG TPA: ATP-binding protein [Chitinophagales bacterium]|nr:ATP-binding protein [Chitinophagales bacterium]